jgi:hypothetical protein
MRYFIKKKNGIKEIKAAQKRQKQAAPLKKAPAEKKAAPEKKKAPAIAAPVRAGEKQSE